MLTLRWRWFLLWSALLLHYLLQPLPGGPLPRAAAPPPPSPRAAAARALPRVLVCIAAHFAPGRTTAHLDRVIAEYRDAYARHYAVSIAVDTNSAELAAHLARSAPGVAVRQWSALELGDPLHLPYVHRHHMQQVLEDYEYLVFTEDDVLLPLASFQFYAARQRELWARGWMFGWVRAELWGGDNATAISIDNIEPVFDPPLYRAPSGQLYAEPWSPYAAFYVLDREQALAMRDDASGVWHNGFPPFLPREKMSVGWLYARTGGASEPYGAKGWRARALTPLDAAGAVLPEAIAWHLPRKYATSTALWFHDLGSVPVRAMFNFTAQGLAAVAPLVQHPPSP
jgi:hypothetical protein